MVKTIIVPKTKDIVLAIPSNFIGKKVEVLLYRLDEVEEKPAETGHKFRGALKLSREQYKDIHNHLKTIRDEWESLPS